MRVSFQDQPSPHVSREGTACIHKAEVSALHEALGQDMREEAAEKLDGVKGSGPRPCTAGFARRESDGAVLEGDDAAIGDGDFQHRGSKVLAGGGAVWIGLAVHMPGAMPDPGVAALQKAGVGHLLLEDRPVDGGEGLDGNKEVRSRREPLGTVLGEPTAWDDVMEVGGVLELPAPGMEDAGKAREVRPEKARVFGEACEGVRGGLAQGRIGSALRRAEKGAEGFGDGAGEEKVRPGKLCVELFVEPVRRFMLRTLGAVAIAAGVGDAVLPATAVGSERGGVHNVRFGSVEGHEWSGGGREAEGESARGTLARRP